MDSLLLPDFHIFSCTSWYLHSRFNRALLRVSCQRRHSRATMTPKFSHRWLFLQTKCYGKAIVDLLFLTCILSRGPLDLRLDNTFTYCSNFRTANHQLMLPNTPWLLAKGFKINKLWCFNDDIALSMFVSLWRQTDGSCVQCPAVWIRLFFSQMG